MSVIVKTLDTILEYVKKTAPEAECRRAYLPETNVADLAAITVPLVTVVPNDRSAKVATQGGVFQNKLFIDIGIQRKLEHVGKMAKLTEEVDPLVGLVETIFNSFLEKTVLGPEGFRVTCQNPNHSPGGILYDPEQMADDHVFISVFQIEAKVTCAHKTQGDGNK